MTTVAPANDSASLAICKRVGVVVHEQTRDAREVGEIRASEVGGASTAGCTRSGASAFVVVHDHQRQLDANRRAAALAGARRVDAAAVRLDEVPADREPQAEPAVRARERAVGLAEALEQVRQELRRDAFAGVADRDLDVRVHALRAEPARGRRAA